MSIKRIVSVLVALLMVFSSVVTISAVEPGSARMKVIDVSRWNDSINWSVASREIDGVIAQIGHRGSVYRDSIAEDPMFYSHMSGALQYSVPFGVYFYSLALNETEAIEEANWVINKLKSYGLKPDMPIYIDAEESLQMNTLNNRQRTDIVHAFCRTMKENGYYAGVYSNKYWMTSLLYAAEFSDYPIWLAEYNSVCTYSGKYGMWQYTNKGNVNGINGNIDLSECYFDYPTFIKKYGYNGYTGSEEPPAETKDYTKSGTYKLSSAMNVRIGPSESYVSLGLLENGSEIYVDYAVDGWGHIPYGTGFGWVKLLSAVSRKSKYMTTQEKIGYYAVNTDVLNVREGPGTSYTKCSELYYGNSVFISGIENGWGWFNAGGTKYWISLDYADFFGTICFETGIDGKMIQPVRFKKGTSAKLTKWNISQTDKTFAGWSLTSGGEVKYADEAEVTMGNSNMVLYAVNISKNAYKLASTPRQSENGMVVISDEGLSEAAFMNKYISVSAGYSYKIEPSSQGITGTGSVVTFSFNGVNKSSLTVVVSGDCNSDGICDGLDLADALNISQGAGSKISYSDAQKKAADINLDGKVNSSDISTIKNTAFGTADLPR